MKIKEGEGMSKEKQNSIFWIVYSLLVVIFVVYSLLAFFPISSARAEEWAIPSTQPSGMVVETSSSGQTCYVTTPQELLYALNLSRSTTIELMNNISLSGRDWPNITKRSQVTINGNNFSLFNISVTGTLAYNGLIANTSAAVNINNLNIYVDLMVGSTSASYVGAIVGYSSAALTLNNVNVFGNIYVFNNSSNSVGGIVGRAISQVNMTNCINYAQIRVDSQDNNSMVGGLLGYISQNTTQVSNCANFGNITLINGYVGGIIGQRTNTGTSSTRLSMTNCFNSGTIYLDDYDGGAGGLVGNLTNAATISHCYNTGNISGQRSDYVGGLVGNAEVQVTVNNCYSIGDLTSRNNGIIEQRESNTERSFGKYKTLGDMLYSQTSSDFPTSSPLNGGGGGGTTSEIVSPTRRYTSSIYLTSLVGGAGGNAISSFYYAPSTGGSEPYVEVDLTVKNSSGSIALGTIIFNQDGTFTMVGGSRTNLVSTDENYISTGPSTLIFNGLVALDYLASDIRMGAYTNGRGYAIVHYDNDETSFQIDFPIEVGAINTPLNEMWLYGCECTISSSGSTSVLVIQPLIGYSINCTDNPPYGNTVNYTAAYSMRPFNREVRIAITSSPTRDEVGQQMTSKPEINTHINELGEEFVIDSSINGGYPILKDFYWAYSTSEN